MLNNKRISLIIPAHNEANNLGRVLSAVIQVKELDEILVVADACQDKTADVAADFGIKVLERAATLGKGDAMIDGVTSTTGDIIMFVDADLETLTPEHIYKVLNPVADGQAAMSVGLRDRILGMSAIIPKIFPMYAIGGERAMTRDFFNSLPKDKYSLDFGIETVMNYSAKWHRQKIAMPVLKNLKQVIKEKKYGFWDGLKSRLALLLQVWKARHIMKRRKNNA